MFYAKSLLHIFWYYPAPAIVGALLCVQIFAPHKSDLYDNNAG